MTREEVEIASEQIDRGLSARAGVRDRMDAIQALIDLKAHALAALDKPRSASTSPNGTWYYQQANFIPQVDSPTGRSQAQVLADAGWRLAFAHYIEQCGQGWVGIFEKFVPEGGR